MTKSETMPVRLETETVEYLESVAKEEKISRSAVLRKLLAKGIEENRKKEAVKLYREGKISIEKAAKIAGTCVSEMMDILKEKGVPLNLTIEDYRRGKKNLLEAFGVSKS